MGFVPNPWAVPGLVAMAAAVAMSAVVYRAAPTRRTNRRLATILFVEGALVGTGTGFLYLTDDVATAYGWQAVGVVTLLSLPFLYLAFLATLDTPLVGPLRTRAASVLLLLGGAALQALFFLRPERFVTGMEPTWYAPWDASFGPWYFAFGQTGLVFFIFALVVAVLAHRHARTQTERRRAFAYAFAFGVRDAVRILLILSFVLYPPTNGGVGDLRFVLSIPLTTLLFLPLLAYGILRTQLFDIDLKIKWTISRTTLAAVFVAVFFVVSQVLQNYFQDYGVLLGGLAAGLLLFAIAPLQRLAERVADAAMPNVRPTSEYLSFRKLEIYRAAVEGVFADGEVSVREREVLVRLKAKLEILEADAEAVERDVRKVSLGFDAAAQTRA